MTPEQSELLVKAAAGILSVIAILLVIAIINRFAKKRAEEINAKFQEQMMLEKENKKQEALKSTKRKGK